LPVVASGHTLQLSAAQANGKAIAGDGAVSIVMLDAISSANLANVLTNSVTVTVSEDVTFSGSFSKGSVSVKAGKTLTLADSSGVGAATFIVAETGALVGGAAVVKGISSITGGVTLTDGGAVAAADL